MADSETQYTNELSEDYDELSEGINKKSEEKDKESGKLSEEINKKLDVISLIKYVGLSILIGFVVVWIGSIEHC